MEYTCIIIDDEMKAATRLESLIVDFTDLNTLLVTTEPEEAINRIRSLKPDIVFLDIEMKKNGFDLIEEVRHRKQFPAFILVTGYDHYAIKAVKESAFDYLMKPVDVDELQEAIHRYKDTRTTAFAEADIKLMLNPREKEVVALLAEGLTSKEIADKLCISKSTVESHRQNLRTKTGAKTTSELIATALKK